MAGLRRKLPRPQGGVVDVRTFNMLVDELEKALTEPGIGVTPAPHAPTHVDGGADELNAPLDVRAYPIAVGTLASRPAAASGLQLFWTTDEHILYRSDGSAWVKLAVADYADLSGIPISFTPAAHASTHQIAQLDAIVGELDPKAYPLTVGTLAGRPGAGSGPMLFWTTDEHILYRSDGLGWTKLAVADYADLSGIPTTFAPSGHNLTHSDAGTDEITVALDPRAYPLASGTLAARPAATIANAGRMYWTDDEHILYRNGGGGTWDAISVIDYADLVGIPNLLPASNWTFWRANDKAAVAGQGLDTLAALTELDVGNWGTRSLIESADIGAQVQIFVNMYIVVALAAGTVVVSIRDTSNTANVLATISISVNAAGNQIVKSAYAAKPAFMSGDKTLAVYTSGGNGAAPDVIYREISLRHKSP